jgi:DNA-binding NarL/FixJ family response regulator
MGQIRVLIAEDDLPLREVMTEVILDEPAFELVGAVGDGGAAIELAAAELPDVVLVDVRMPAGGGLAATRGILEVSARSSVIAFTGHDDGAVATELFEAGVSGYLVKGSSIEEIVSAIRAAAAGQLTRPT